MAGRGPTRKAAGTAVGHDKSRGQQLVTRNADGTLLKPPPPTGLPAVVRRAWDELWASDIAVLLQRSDLAALRRLFLLYSERETCHREVDRTHEQRIPLETACKLGLSGELQHELGDDGTTHTFVVISHSGRVAIGSQGQMVLSPWAKDLRSIDSEIRQLEDRFGLNVRARTSLALVVRPPDAPPPPASTPPEEPAADDDSSVIDSF